MTEHDMDGAGQLSTRRVWRRVLGWLCRSNDTELSSRALLLSSLLLVFLAWTVTWVLFLRYYLMPSEAWNSTLIVMYGVLGVGFLLAAALNRRGCYSAAAVLTVVLVFAGISSGNGLTLSGELEPYLGSNNTTFLAYLVVPVVVAAVLLGPWWTAVIACGSLVVVVSVPIAFAHIGWGAVMYGPLMYVAGVSGILLLITYLLSRQGRRAYLELQQQEERYRSLFEQSPDAVFLVNTDGLIEAVNRTGLALFGYDLCEMAGQHIRVVYANPDDRSAVIARVEREGHVKDEVLRLRRSDGSVMDCLVTIQRRTDSLGHPAGYQTIVRDVTERVRSEEDLRLKGALLDNAYDAILLVDPGGEIVYANEAAAQMTGYGVGDLTGMNMRHLNTEEGARQVPERISRMMREGGLEFETVWVQEEGYRIDVEVKTRTVQSQGRTLFLSVARDVTRRKADEAALRLRGELLDAAQDAVFLHDVKGKIMYANEAAARQRGCSRDELMGMNVRDLDGVEDAALFRRRISEVVAERTIVFEGHHVRKDGSTMPVEVQAKAIESDGRILVLAIARDIGERQKAEAAVRASEEKFRTLFEQSIDAISISRPDGTGIEANTAWLTLFGYDRSELPGLNFRDLYVDAADRGLFLEAIEEKEFLEDEVRLKKKDGTEFICRRSAVARRNEEGETILYQGVFHDVTEERRAEQELRDSEARFRALIEHTGLAMTLTTVDGAIIDFNEVFTRMLGYTPEEMLGMRSIEVYARREDREHLIAHVVKHGYIRGAEVEFKKKDGESIFVSLTSALVSQRSGSLIISQSLDITERKAFEWELEASREELRKLTAYLEDAREKERTGIARELHDQLGQALTALNMDLDGVRRAVDGGDSVPVERLQRMEELLQDTVNDVRRISSELRPGMLDDAGLLAALEWQLDQFSSRSGVEFTLDSRGDDAELERPQATALFRVFQELLTNVARHADASRVWVEFECAEGKCILTVSDDGRGISAEQTDDPSSLGIIGMTERLRPLHGDIEFLPRTDGGTMVRVTMPIAQRE